MHHPPDEHRHFRLRKAVWRMRRAGISRSITLIGRRIVRPAWFAGLILSLAGCLMPAPQPTTTPTPLPTITPTPDPNGWQPITAGLERRIYRPSGGFLTQITAIRIDPTYYTFRSHYRPGEPLFLNGWQTAYPEAAVIVNTNFFDRADEIIGLLVADGTVHGSSYRRRGGTFFVQNGVPNVQSLLVQGYNGERYEQAVQAFPMLITDGERSYFDTRPDRLTRRTVIGIDQQGRVTILITSFGGITLLDLAVFLEESDLGLQQALNLDGGGSSLLGVSVGNEPIQFQSFDPVPAVLGVYPR